MTDDNNDGLEVPAQDDPAETVGQVAGEIGEGLNTGAENVPEEEADVRAALETASDAAGVVANVAGTAAAGAELVEGIEAGDEGRIASGVGNLTGGVLGAAGAAFDGVADLLPAEAAEAAQALSTAATVARGVGGAARSVERVVSTYQAIEAAVEGPRVVFHTGADLGDDRLVARGAEGGQGLSGLYEFRVLVKHDVEGGLDERSIDGLLQESARLGLNRDTGADADVYGVVRRVEMLPVTQPRPTHYQLTLVPKLWRLKLVTRSRVFQDSTHLEVVLEVLAWHGLALNTYVIDGTEETYPTHEYVVQYQETDFDFISRLLEYNGIHYRFEQRPGTEAMMLGDRNASFAPVQQADELRYHPHEFAADDNSPRVWGLRRVRRSLVAEVVLRDFNWRTPLHPVRVTEVVDEASGYGSLDLYGEHVRDRDEGARLALVRAQEQLVEGHTFEMKTALRGVRPGTYFDLVDHPHPDLNQRYVVIATDEGMDDGRSYLNTFKAIPFTVTYRPPRRVPWPRVEGILNAIVDGEARSTATPIDEDGRYRVVLPLDEGAAAGGSASRWVRRAQPSAGAGYGMHLPLHIGTEVAVGHVNGDPDRPVILGAVSNTANPSPVVGGNATQSRLRTGSGVVIEMDDDC